MNDRSGLRLIILGVLVFSLPITLLGRLWYMQALAGSQYVAAVNANATSVVRVLAPRGAIVDDVGNPLARNDSALVVSALSTALPKANLGTLKHPVPNPARTQEMQRLSAVLGIPAAELDAKATLCDYFDYGAAAPTKNPGLLDRFAAAADPAGHDRQHDTRRHAEGHADRAAGARAAGVVPGCNGADRRGSRLPRP